MTDLVLVEFASDFGGGYKIVSPGRCVRCKLLTRVRVGVGGQGNDGERSADPRGVCGMRAAVTVESDGYSAPAPAIACWKCLYESGEASYQSVYAELVAKHGWVKTAKGGA